MSAIKYLDTTFDVIMGASSTATEFTIPDLRARFPLGASSETDIDITWSIKRGASTGSVLPWGSSGWQGTLASSDLTEYPPYFVIYYIMKASSSATLTTQEVQSKLEAL